jgi:hypothetical protein
MDCVQALDSDLGTMTIVEFGEGVREELAQYLLPDLVSFRGSLANASFDEFSDVDVQASVRVPLDGGFFAGLENCLQRRYGPALVRYDPDYRETTMAQDVRFSFYGLPVFWRVDFRVWSNQDARQKHPNPFPDWSTGDSALMNVIWALKYNRRRRTADANHYIAAACRKIGLQPVDYTVPKALAVLAELACRDDVSSLMLGKTRDAVSSAGRLELWMLRGRAN